ncbi:MAG: hypothetical protein WD055_06455 [Candidatus Dependentiae bacterium]
MNMLSFCLLLIFYTISLYGADQPPKFTVECNHPTQHIKKLTPGLVHIWKKTCAAICSDQWDEFNTLLSPLVINKVHTTTDNSKNINTYQTLIEYALALGTTANRNQMIHKICGLNLFTQSTYTVIIQKKTIIKDGKHIHPSLSRIHQTPIYYAIQKGNIPAFQALWDRDNSIMLPWEKGKKLYKRSDGTTKEVSDIEMISIAEFIEKRISFEKDKTNAQTLNKMLAYTAQSSCIIQ